MSVSPSPEPEIQGHILVHCFGDWGHIRPLCNLAGRIVRYKPINITFLISPTFYNLAKLELSRSFGKDEERQAERIKLVGLKEDVTVLSVGTGDAIFEDIYKAVVETGSLTCSVTKAQFDGLTHPDAVILDFFGFGPLQLIRQASRKPVKVLAWQTGAISYMLRVFGPVTEEGIGHWEKVVATKAAETGKNFLEAADQLLTRSEGTIIDIPGLPKMYDWECFPQPLPLFPVGFISTQMYQLLRACDGIIHTDAAAYEAEFIKTFSKWFGEDRGSYCLGPILPASEVEAAQAGELMQSPKGQEIKQFLNKSVETHGPHSVLYISFGTFWWPAEPEKVWAFVEAVMELKVPFIMSHGSPRATIPPELVKKAQDSGVGIFVQWAPQQSILAHEATGWFMSHCGQNSVLESLSYGVPMIAWPQAIDQVVNAVHISTNIKAGYELFETRSGEMGLKAILRTGKTPEGTIDAVRREAKEVLELARGPDGQTRRANAIKVKEEMAQAWNEDGPAFTDFRKLLGDINLV
ncbi:UDP-Glycosyltransferase/glycogen phosphorylase [Punctularia strigosozonata HHB-11173 SS5]|uniref:UDP-Glycosyltransferase/glycogen phosphorylase n=1 Tax=Punctularia strigosozonata (strain HHB-11173) TaxID=741275 RepID=UPI0004416C31|nr:UDP-Glycosyltransferase/glycogen phosphorylase [Punctularia strigosozonata HHB-11173 SS5]EIN06277.1 UDP-Glycosyltransferase/glycogen phosphorylase [Punctularia strigosozonata HHB-11173 SS5]